MEPALFRPPRRFTHMGGVGRAAVEDRLQSNVHRFLPSSLF
jgi:hypothetical protein